MDGRPLLPLARDPKQGKDRTRLIGLGRSGRPPGPRPPAGPAADLLGSFLPL